MKSSCRLWTVLVSLILPLWVMGGDFEVKAKAQFETSSQFTPPTGWMGPKFELSRSYPAMEPTPEVSPSWMGVDFRTSGQEAEYLKRVLEYCLEGNVAVDFKVQDNAIRKWYHTPWMHYGPAGREPIRGLTSERPAPKKFLNDAQNRRVQCWAVGYYNAPGGWVIGQFWNDPANPNSSMPRFPVGTVVFKLLFTDATSTEVPYLAESLEWEAMINKTGPAPDFDIQSSRVPTPVGMKLLQIDVAVRDSRADSTTGWVFGTFVYDVALKTPGDTVWKRMRPVGLMWGNDPGYTPGPGTKPGEGWLNPLAEAQLTTSVRTVLGYQGRVNGPVDNPISSCISCHMTAQDKPAPITTQAKNTHPDTFYHTLPNTNWFRNLKPSDPFRAGEKSLDYSLQLARGLDNFSNWKKANFTPGGAPITGLIAENHRSIVERGGEIEMNHAKPDDSLPADSQDKKGDPKREPPGKESSFPNSLLIIVGVLLLAVLGFLMWRSSRK